MMMMIITIIDIQQRKISFFPILLSLLWLWWWWWRWILKQINAKNLAKLLLAFHYELVISWFFCFVSVMQPINTKKEWKYKLTSQSRSHESRSIRRKRTRFRISSNASQWCGSNFFPIVWWNGNRMELDIGKIYKFFCHVHTKKSKKNQQPKTRITINVNKSIFVIKVCPLFDIIIIDEEKCQ